MSETPIPVSVEPAPAHEHRWRVTFYEHTAQVITYRCRDCGMEKADRAELAERKRERRA